MRNQWLAERQIVSAAADEAEARVWGFSTYAAYIQTKIDTEARLRAERLALDHSAEDQLAADRLNIEINRDELIEMHGRRDVAMMGSFTKKTIKEILQNAIRDPYAADDVLGYWLVV